MKPLAPVRSRLCRACAATTLLLMSACGGSEGTDPSSVASLQVTVNTTGINLDADGYTLLVQGTERGPLGAVGGTATVTDLAPGSVSVGLSGVVENCAVTGQNPRSITLTAGQVTTLAFAVICSPAVGTIEIITTTTGPDSDPDGYMYQLDATPVTTIAANGSVQLGGVLVLGSHTVTLSGVANNCTLAGGASRTVVVSAGTTSPVTFEVTCVARVGTIQITASSQGRALDPDGFTVQVDAGSAQAVPGNGTLTISVPAGSRTISFAGAAENCSITTPTSQTVSVAYQGTVSITMEALCPGTLGGRILFRGFNGLGSMAPDGTNAESLPPIPSLFAEPTASPDGQTIAYWGHNANSVPRIYTVRYDGKNYRQLSPQSVFCAEEPAWSPDGASIAFTNCDDQTIWVMNPDGTNSRRVTPSGISGDAHPDWSPDGTRLAFAHNAQLGIMNSDGSGRTIIDPGLTLAWPRWSPSGTRILFTGGATIVGEGNLYTMNPDGTARDQLTTTGVAFRARWSPDGQFITYTQSGSAHGVYTMQQNGSVQTRVTPADSPGTDPFWVE